MAVTRENRGSRTDFENGAAGKDKEKFKAVAKR